MRMHALTHTDPRAGTRLRLLLGLGAVLVAGPLVVAPAPAAPVGIAYALASGDYHVCALTTSGVKCWGNNGSGDLGNGTTARAATPVAVIGLAGAATALSAGLDDTCAVTRNGAPECWGYNGNGQLGNGTTVNSVTPAPVVGLTAGVKAIASGQYHTCAVTLAGAVECWGDNTFGELGDGTTVGSATPVAVGGLTTGAVAITAGRDDTCALMAAGTVECWGNDYFGQLGDATTRDSPVPVAVTGLSGPVTAISAGDYHTCALTRAGAVECWGYNYSGELGDGARKNRSTPVAVIGLNKGVTEISAGLYHTCARLTSGAVRCWGYNYYGQLGDGTTANRSRPVRVRGLTRVTSVVAGGYHTCALRRGGTVGCWGDNGFGELGDGTTRNRSAPIAPASCARSRPARRPGRPRAARSQRGCTRPRPRAWAPADAVTRTQGSR
jgi:alpha-tubulin suppressor-like RCC1 family protein